MTRCQFLAVLAAAVCASGALADERETSFQRVVAPFFERHCLDCHGLKRSKGGVALHLLGGDLRACRPQRWDKVLDMIERGTMPPETEEQPKPEERRAVVAWIRGALRDETRRVREPAVGTAAAERPPLRRLTNVEYQNTMRDLLGFELNFVNDLPKDPFKAYTFTNTSEFMQLGPEQLEAYRNCARRALASAIVDSAKPQTFKKRQEKPVRDAASFTDVPRTGEFRIRMQASAKFPPGVTEMPLRLVVGEHSANSIATLRKEPVGTVRLKSGEGPAVYEFRGRLENFPVEKGHDRKGRPLPGNPDMLTVTLQNLYDDGTLNEKIHEFPVAVVDWLEFETLTDEWPPAHHRRILFDSPLRESEPEKYIREVLRRFMARAFRRPAADEEVARFAQIYAALQPELKTIEATLRETLALVLVSPQFLLHNAASPEQQQYAFANRLSYFLWASMPDDELLDLAAKGGLDRPEVVEKQVRRMLDDPRAQAFVREFSQQWLSIEKMRTVPINRDLFPRFLFYVLGREQAGTEAPYRPTIRDYMIDETLAFVAHLVRTNASVFNIVDSDFACLNQPLAAHYGVPGVQGHEIRPVPLKPEYRLGGLLTQGSVLIGNGTGSAPHPIYRAVWLREAVLGEDVPPPPADVPALMDTAGAAAAKAATIKDLLARHRQQASCNACHARLDPWGIPFEQYNAIGKYQPVVPNVGTRVSPFNLAVHKDLEGYGKYLKSLNTQTVDAEARVPNGPAVNGMDELKAYLLKERKGDIARNVQRRLYAYALGRELIWRDRFAVEDMLAVAGMSGYGMRDMIMAVCRHDSFRGTAIEERKKP